MRLPPRGQVAPGAVDSEHAPHRVVVDRVVVEDTGPVEQWLKVSQQFVRVQAHHGNQVAEGLRHDVNAVVVSGAMACSTDWSRANGRRRA